MPSATTGHRRHQRKEWKQSRADWPPFLRCFTVETSCKTKQTGRLLLGLCFCISRLLENGGENPWWGEAPRNWLLDFFWAFISLVI
jgi:hypothetical protein